MIMTTQHSTLVLHLVRGSVNLFLRFIFFAFFLSLGICLSREAWAQKASYISAIDQDLSIEKVAVVNVVDNVSGIYAKPLEEHLRNLIQKQKTWDLTEQKPRAVQAPEELEENPKEVAALLKSLKVQGLITLRISRGPAGVSMKLNLFVGKDGFLLAQEKVDNLSQFDVKSLQNQLAALYENIKKHVPYSGEILSRRGQQITMNFGRNQGALENSEVSVIQIFKLNRHPKYKFIVSVDKEILGRVRITKVEDSISFATILSEKEAGCLSVGNKVMTHEFVTYADPGVSADGKVLNELAERGDKEVSLGNKPVEWVPDTPPTFGKVALLLGIGNYSYNTNLTTAGAITGSKDYMPSIALESELWINPKFQLEFDLRDSVGSISNPLSGSSPSTLNVSLMHYQLLASYSFLIAEDFFGPKINLKGGFATHNTFVDSSTPLGLNSTSYTGMVLGVGGSFPISPEVPYILGADLYFYLNSDLSESPQGSGGANNTINTFDFYLAYQMKQRLRLRGEILFDQFSSSFSGGGSRTDKATSSSQNMTTLMGGLEYMF